jgi:hypothetical protein
MNQSVLSFLLYRPTVANEFAEKVGSEHTMPALLSNSFNFTRLIDSKHWFDSDSTV